jgi:hypothetical protein
MTLFGAARLYLVCAGRIERDLVPSDRDYVPPHRDGAWALWAKTGAARVEIDRVPPLWRVKPGPVHIAHGRSVSD